MSGLQSLIICVCGYKLSAQCNWLVQCFLWIDRLSVAGARFARNPNSKVRSALLVRFDFCRGSSSLICAGDVSPRAGFLSAAAAALLTGLLTSRNLSLWKQFA